MSIFGALSTAVSGMQAQSRSLGHISDNIANAQTVGYKRVETSFDELVLQSSSNINHAGGVFAAAKYTNDIQGTTQQVDRTTNLQLQGGGFFSVSKLLTTASGDMIPSQDRYYTRDGSFDLNSQRILVNNSGYALNGYAFDTASGRYATEATPIQVTSEIDAPVATTSITLAANLPSKPTDSTALSSTNIGIYDAAGNPRDITLNWRPGTVENSWRLTIDTPDAIGTGPLEGSLPGNPVGATAAAPVPAVKSRAQTSALTLTGPGIKVGDIYTATVNGISVSTTITQSNAGQILNMAGVAQSLADQINSASPSPGVQAGVVNGRLEMTALSPGTAFTLTGGVTNGTPATSTVGTPVVTAPTATAGEIQAFGFSGSTIDIGDVYSVDAGAGEPVSVTVTASNISALRNINGVIQALAAQVNNQAGAIASAKADGTTLTLTHLTANSSFATPPEVTITPGSTGTNSASAATLIGNAAGSRQTQRIALQGTPGDVGAVYSVRVAGPTPVTPAAGDVVQTRPASATETNQVDVSFGAGATATQVGEQYSVAVGGTAYSLLITADNQAQYATREQVAQKLAADIGGDAAGPATASHLGGTHIQVTGKQVNVTLDMTQPTATRFDEVVTYTTTGEETSLDEIAGLIATKINAVTGLPVTAASVDGGVTLTGSTDTVSFLATPSASAGDTPAYIGLDFGGTLPDGTKGTAGTLTAVSMDNVAGGNATAPAGRNPGDPAEISFQVDYGNGPQTITLKLGNFNSSDGVTQYQGDDINVTSLQQDGSPQGTFQDVEITGKGEVVANYDNGRRRVLARIPVAMFNNTNGLNRESGNAFTESFDSGSARLTDVGTNGAGALVVSSLEGSNVDIADEFTKLIVAQRAYSANTKVVTTSDEMLTETVGLKR